MFIHFVSDHKQSEWKLFAGFIYIDFPLLTNFIPLTQELHSFSKQLVTGFIYWISHFYRLTKFFRALL